MTTGRCAQMACWCAPRVLRALHAIWLPWLPLATSSDVQRTSLLLACRPPLCPALPPTPPQRQPVRLHICRHCCQPGRLGPSLPLPGTQSLAHQQPCTAARRAPAASCTACSAPHQQQSICRAAAHPLCCLRLAAPLPPLQCFPRRCCRCCASLEVWLAALLAAWWTAAAPAATVYGTRADGATPPLPEHDARTAVWAMAWCEVALWG